MKQLNICTAFAEKNGKGEWGEKPRESVTVKLERDKSEYPKAVRHFCRNRKLRQKAKGVLYLFGFSFVVCSSVSVDRIFSYREEKLMKKRALSFMLGITLILSLLPTAVLAEDTKPAQITVPSDAKVSFALKDYSGYNYKPFIPVENFTINNNENDTVTYSFEGLTSGKDYYYRISGDEYVTYAGYETYQTAAGFSLDITKEDLQPEGKSKATVDRTLSGNNGNNVADILLNINAQGYLKMTEVGDTYQLIYLRSWEAINSTTANVFVEPDYHFTVVDTNGAPNNSVVEISAEGLITAVGNGTAIVLVTYDAMNYKQGLGGTFYGAIWPENTGVFVVSVGTKDSGIETGMTINEGVNTDKTKYSGNALDAEHDVIYFIGDRGEFTFQPEDGCTVSIANPALTEQMTFTGFAPVDKNADGSFTIPLVTGRNIAKIAKDGKCEYQVITAKKVSYTINNGAPVYVGDPISIVFDTVFHPANKLAGLYNFQSCIVYDKVDGYDGKKAGSVSQQYNFASNSKSQTVCNTLKAFMPGFAKDTALTVPENYEYDVLTLSDGKIYISGFGDAVGNHRGITLDSGKNPNLNAGTITAYLGRLPDIEIPISVENGTLSDIAVSLADEQKTYYIGDVLTIDDFAVTANYDNAQTQTASNFTISPSVLTEGANDVTITYRGKTDRVTVTAVKDEMVSIEVTKAPNKTSYTTGDAFDPSGMVVTATCESGRKTVITDYSYAPKRTLTANDTAMTITAGTVETTTSISVSAPSVNPPSTITVFFTLLGDDHHDSDTDGVKHTLQAGNLTTWIAKTKVTVPAGSNVTDVLAKALGSNGIPYENASGSYVSSVRGLAEFSNGANSGWMYTLNGNHPQYGVDEQSVKNGDNIVFHYTDDYTSEQGSAQWSDTPTGKKETPTGSSAIEAKVTVSGNTATAIITADAIKASVENAMKSGDNTVKIALKDTGKAETIAAAIPAVGIKSIISDTRAALNIESCKGSISIPNDTLKAIAKQLGNADLSVSVATKPASEIKAENINTKDAVIVEVTLCANDKAITSFGGNALNLSIPVNDKFEVGKRYRVKEISADGSVKTLTGKCVIESGEPVMQTSTTGLSIFVVTTDVVNAFADTVGHWYTDAINYAAENGLMNGTADGLFSPDVTLSRAMVVTILARLDGAARTTGEHWYSSAQQWSIHNGISDGTNMAGDISREQLAVMLYRYAKLKGYDTVKRADLSCFEDYGSVHSWAQSAMSWANASGLISGRSATALAPRGNTTRAEAAAILMRFCETTSKTTESDDAKLNAALTNAASAVLKAAPAPTVGSIGGEWAVIGLVRSEAIVPSDYFAAYVERVSDYVKKSSGILSTRKCTEYSRITLALTMVGQDASSFASYDLTSPLLDYDKVLSQGINGPIWALLALDSGNYAAGNKEIRQKYVDYILSKQFADGGWNLSGTSADADITAMALQALAKYQGQSSVKSAVNAALSCLSKMQNNDGSFSSGKLPTAESCAQVLIALSVLDISADDSRFVKSGATVLDALLNYQLSDGSFCHITGGTSNQMAAEQALLALVAVKATQSGKSIYQLDSELRHAA